MTDQTQTLALEYLAQSTLFGSLSNADMARVFSLMRPVGFDNGQLIFSKGDEGNGLFLVMSGRVRLSVLTGDGRELSLAHAAEGDIFGEIAALDGGERTADATAITAVKALALSSANLKAVMQDNPRVASAAINFVCARLRETDQKLEGVALHSIETRLARFILSTIEQSGMTRKGRVTVDLGISQSEIGLLIGASRPKVNGAFSVLEASGAITRDGTILVCSMPILLRSAAWD